MNCSYCGRPIRFIKNKDRTRKSIPVNASTEYFVPEEGAPTVFVLSDGTIQPGRAVPDGRKGYRLHNCKRGGI